MFCCGCDSAWGHPLLRGIKQSGTLQMCGIAVAWALQSWVAGTGNTPRGCAKEGAIVHKLTSLLSWGRCLFPLPSWDRNRACGLRERVCGSDSVRQRARSVFIAVSPLERLYQSVCLCACAYLCTCKWASHVWFHQECLYFGIPDPVGWKKLFSLVTKLSGMLPYPAIVRSDVFDWISLICEMKATAVCPSWSEKWDLKEKSPSATLQNKPGLSVLTDNTCFSLQGL